MAEGTEPFVIPIEAPFPDGDATVAQLEALSATLTGAGKRSDDFQSAIKRISSGLDVAKASSDSANAALKDGAEQYRVLEREAIRSAKALERSQVAGKFDPRAARSAAEASAALGTYGDKLAVLEKNAAAATAGQGRLSNALKAAEKAAAGVDAKQAGNLQKLEKLQAAVSRLPGPLGVLGGKLVGTAKAGEGLAAAFGSTSLSSVVMIGAIAAVAAALVVATVAAVAGYVAFGNYAAGQADAARTAALSREAFANLSGETAAAVAGFDAVSEATGATDAQLVTLTKQLRAAKVSAANMPEALRAAALAERALGSGGSSEFIDRIKDGTLAVGEFAKVSQAKFGGVVARQLQGLDAQSARFSKLWGKLFDGLNPEPVLQAVGILVGMFDKANPLAQTLAGVIKEVFDPIANNAVSAAQAIEAFALGFAIQATKIYLAGKPVFDLFGDLTLSLTGAKTAGEAFATVAAVIAGGIGLVGVLLFGLPAIIGFVFSKMVELGGMFVEWGKTVGAQLIQGMVDGIVGMVGSIVSAITGTVGAGITAAKDLLGIASPSKVFAEIGDNTVAGFTGAVDAGAGDAQGSMAALVGDSATAPAQAAAAAPGGKAGGGSKIDLAGATFNFYGVKDGESAKQGLADLLTSILEDDATSLAGAAL
jgi:hypothetical protein